MSFYFILCVMIIYPLAIALFFVLGKAGATNSAVDANHQAGALPARLMLVFHILLCGLTSVWLFVQEKWLRNGST
jgi:hypothetical protein